MVFVCIIINMYMQQDWQIQPLFKRNTKFQNKTRDSLTEESTAQIKLTVQKYIPQIPIAVRILPCRIRDDGSEEILVLLNWRNGQSIDFQGKLTDQIVKENLGENFQLKEDRQILTYSKVIEGENQFDEDPKQLIKKQISAYREKILELVYTYSTVGCHFSKKKLLLKKKKLQASRLLKRVLQKHDQNSKSQCCKDELKTELQEFEGLDSQSSKCFKKIKNVAVCSQNESKSCEIFGGYFKVAKFQANLTLQNGENLQKVLAVKQSRNQKIPDEKSLIKIQQELNFIKKIRNPEFIATYYNKIQQQNSSENKKGTILMDYYENNLIKLLKQGTLTIFQKFDISLQLVKALIKLHQDGLVHRDIKPGNILFDQDLKLKLIDFGESMECWKKVNLQNCRKVGATIPYSPLECSVTCPQGYSKLKIDNWSVGMVISEILNSRKPISYSRCYLDTIKKGWNSGDYSLCYNLRAKSQFDKIFLPLRILCIKLLKLRYQERFCLTGVEELLSFYSSKQFFKEIKQNSPTDFSQEQF